MKVFISYLHEAPLLWCLREHFRKQEEQGDPEEPDWEVTLLPGMPVAGGRDKGSTPIASRHWPTCYLPAISQGWNVVRGDVLDVQISISRECGNVRLCCTFHRGHLMLSNLPINGAPASLGVSRIWAVKHKSGGSTQTLFHKLHVDVTKHVYNSWTISCVLKLCILTRWFRSIVFWASLHIF